jgi:hypothetical protein
MKDTVLLPFKKDIFKRSNDSTVEDLSAKADKGTG